MSRIASFISCLKDAAQYGHASDREVRISAEKRIGGEGRGGAACYIYRGEKSEKGVIMQRFSYHRNSSWISI